MKIVWTRFVVVIFCLLAWNKFSKSFLRLQPRFGLEQREAILFHIVFTDAGAFNTVTNHGIIKRNVG